jgi:hypothetical protein
MSVFGREGLQTRPYLFRKRPSTLGRHPQARGRRDIVRSELGAFFSFKSPKLYVCKRLMLPSPSSHAAGTLMLSAVRTNFAHELG